MPRKSEVKIFATNNLVRDYDIYKNYMNQRREFLKTNNSKPTDLLFPFGGRNKIRPSFNLTPSDRIAIIKWHCIATSYMIWQDCVKDCSIVRSGAISYKKVYDVSDDILKKFKYRVERTLENTRCDLNNVYKSKHPDQGKEYDACRYLAMCWTYLDIVKDDKTQRYFPSLDTIKRAAKIFGYSETANPFEMNGIYWRRDKETKNMEEKKVTYSLDLDTPLKDIGLSVRSFNALWRAGYHTLGDIVNLKYEDLIKVRNLGLHSTKEILEKINELQTAAEESEESVIDIAEQAAEEIEEEAKLNSAETIHPYDYNSLLEKFNKLKDDYDALDAKYDDLLGKSKELGKQNYDLLKSKSEMEAFNFRLRDSLQNLRAANEDLKAQGSKLSIAANPKNLDTFTLLNTVLEKMKDSKMEYILLTIDGMTIDIHPAKSFPLRTSYQIRSSER